MDARCIRIKKFADTKISGYVWTGPKAAKIVHEWNGHLEIFSLHQAIENSRQFLPLRTDISEKTVVSYP